MTKTGLYGELSAYYDLIYSFKDYKKEAEIILSLIQKFKVSEDKELLDVACGTAKHLQFLTQQFNCMGVDVSPEMLRVAEEKLPAIKFQQADMVSMRLGKQFDVITCLFSAIGYVKTYENLRKTWQSFALHLKPGGVAIVEPWFTREQYKVGYPSMTIYDHEDIKITRLAVSNIRDHLSVLDFHYLVAEKNKEVRLFRDRHEVALFEVKETLEIMEKTGFKAQFLSEGLTSEGRGLYIGIKI